MLKKSKALVLVVQPDPVDGVRSVRQEWESTGADLMTRAPIGLVLYDICRALGFAPDATREALGDELYKEVS
jgi:hypothetical protein